MACEVKIDTGEQNIAATGGSPRYSRHVGDDLA
jgi:hypothetical protein